MLLFQTETFQRKNKISDFFYTVEVINYFIYETKTFYHLAFKYV